MASLDVFGALLLGMNLSIQKVKKVLPHLIAKQNRNTNELAIRDRIKPEILLKAYNNLYTFLLNKRNRVVLA